MARVGEGGGGHFGSVYRGHGFVTERAGLSPCQKLEARRQGLEGGMLNVEWKMFNVELRTQSRRALIQHSTFNIWHSTFRLLAAAASACKGVVVFSNSKPARPQPHPPPRVRRSAVRRRGPAPRGAL